MSVLGLLVPASLLLGGVSLPGCLWTLRAERYDDLEGAAARIPLDDDAPPERRGRNRRAAAAGLHRMGIRLHRREARERAHARTERAAPAAGQQRGPPCRPPPDSGPGEPVGEKREIAREALDHLASPPALRRRAHSPAR